MKPIEKSSFTKAYKFVPGESHAEAEIAQPTPPRRTTCAARRLHAFDIGGLEHVSLSDSRNNAEYLDLAARLDKVSAAAATLSDRLALRYFTHVGDVGRQTLAA